MVLLADLSRGALEELLARYSLSIERVSSDASIPGSYWEAPEAGLIDSRLFVSEATPVHSALHEACHFICMDGARRAQLHRDAGGDDPEENAVCYLQVLLADYLLGVGRERMFADMDAWGYSFRLGSARAWFEQDAEDARAWLLRHEVIDAAQRPTWRLRDHRSV